MRRAPRGALLLLLCAVALPAAADEPRPAPPLEEAFLPKDDLRVPPFLAAHPQADGRGIVVAVLDTGLDPGHPRLAKTSTGERKILDLLDATDDGLVDCPIVLTEAEVAAKEAVGPTGRRLALGAHARPGREHRLGRVDAESALPPDLVERVAARRREAHADARRRARDAAPAAARPGETPDAARARQAAEQAAAEALPDASPAYDVLLVRGEDGWLSVLDTDADGDLGEERALADYARAGDWTTLQDDAGLNVAVRPDADGRRVRLLFDGDGHGTHVAGIVAGFEAPGHALNGLAPGARIVGIKVGNSRFGGVTTNFAIARALDLAGAAGAHVVNLSFGGSSFLGDAGTPDARVADLAVERYGLLCCFSAGNEGPALSTVGSPATARRVLSVGAHVSPAKMRASYSLLGDDPGERLFGFSSRGPLPGGGLGVSVLAPGAAWSTLPSWRLVRGDNWNGTSMAAPQVAGACALLLSAARAEGVPAPPARVQRALRATARPVPGLLPFEQGAGLVQVDRAYEALARMKGAPEERPLVASVSNPTGVGAGIYERDARAPFDRRVDVAVDWPEGGAHDARTGYERRLVLSCDAPWVQVPPRLGLNAEGSSFTARVDPTGLPEGVHAAIVVGTDPDRPDDGPELVVPVTLGRTSETDADGVFRATIRVAPGERAARFLRVPVGASRLRVRATQREGAPSVLTLAVGAVDQWRRPQDRTSQARASVGAGQEGAVEAAVMAGTVAEVVVFSHWGQNAAAAFDVEARFLGPASPDAQVAVGPGEDVALLRLASLGAFDGRVSAKVDRVVERPPVCRTVEPDPRGPLFGSERLFVARQTFSLRVGDGETLRVRPLGTSALDEVREDARWRVRDAAGRTVKKAVIDGAFDLHGLPAGEYAVEYETPTFRREPAECGTTGFEVLRPRPEAGVAVHPTADLAAAGAGASDRVELPARATRSVALRLPALPEGALYAGEVSVVDGDGRVRLTLPLVVDRRTAAAPSADDLQRDLAAAWRARVEAVATDPDADEPARAAALETIERIRRLPGAPATDLDLAVHEAALRARGAADVPAREAAATRLAEVEATLDRAQEGHRPLLGRLFLARAALLRADGRAKEAGAAFAEARFLLPAGDPGIVAERVARGRAEGGDRRDALEAARARAAARPTDFAAASAVVDALLDLGWPAVAAGEVRGWPARFPARVAEHRAAAARVRDAGGDPAPRTLESLRAGAP